MTAQEFKDFNEAFNLEDHYVCARCWGALKVELPRTSRIAIVYCPACGKDETQGFVTLQYARRRQAESASELSEAKHNLREAMNLKHESTDLGLD